MLEKKTFEEWMEVVDIKKIINKATHNYRKQIERDDIKQTAYLALLKAVKSYNPDYKEKDKVAVPFPRFFACILYNDLNSICNKGKREYLVEKNKNPIYVNRQQGIVFDVTKTDLDFLDDDEKILLYKRFSEEKTLVEMGKEYGVSYEWVRQKLKKALEKVKEAYQEEEISC